MTERECFFNTKEYFDYLKTHCGTNSRETEGRVAGTDIAEKILSHLDIKPGSTTLEIGCGVGRILQLIEEKFGNNVVGCDICKDAIESLKIQRPDLASKLYATPSDALLQVPSSNVDYIVTWGVFELTDQRKTLVEMARLLKVGGRAMLGSIKNANYHKDDLESSLAHEAYITKNIPIRYTDVDALENLIQYLGLRVIKRIIFEYKKDLTDSKYHIAEDKTSVFAEAVYIIEKTSETPINGDVTVIPSTRRPNHVA